ncbi:hypothetical protein [Nonomuraea pusilla]|uniref:Dolichyl-phosphate-mannose-protein mannosyltransferase n=1 Tax=Nonomuraea pusilla TaxID=46177 RepID=A0A1H8BDT8_9ACTN|nr:hypothetical protein [Nonomuraea pusilla]SEM80916.1 hypothetical protein SAMN05660976_06113 [Nonomuraea pusilla]
MTPEPHPDQQDTPTAPPAAPGPREEDGPPRAAPGPREEGGPPREAPGARGSAAAAGLRRETLAAAWRRARGQERLAGLWGRVPGHGWLAGLWRRRVRGHGWFAGVLAAGVALRVAAMLGYRPALWFPDTYTYVVTVFRPRPDLVRPAGYSMFLKLFEPLHSFAVVTAAQHLLGLATGVLVYVVAVRRAPRWAATLAAVPVLLDAYQVELEHLLVSDTLFMFLVMAAVALALRGRPPVVAIGLLLAAATLTRTVGQPFVVLAVAWVALRGRLRPAVTLLAVALVPILAYGAWFYAAHQRVGLVGANGVFLYARTMSFADCAEMNPPPDLRTLCDPRPPSRRPPSQEYIWSKDSPLVARPGITFTEETDALAGRFARLAITSQPLDYAASVLSELGRTFTWDRPVYPDPEIYGYYQFPRTPPGPPGRYPARVGAQFAERYEQGPIGTRIVEPFAGWLRGYQAVARVPGSLLLVALLTPPAAALWRRRSANRGPRGGAWRRVPDRLLPWSAGRGPRVGAWRRVPDWLVPWSAAVVLLVVPAAVAEFDYRYVLPAAPLAFLAAALGLRGRSEEGKGFVKDIPRNVRA